MEQPREWPVQDEQPGDEQGTWTDWLTAPGVSGVVKAVAAGSTGARQAITRFQLARAAGCPPGCRWLRLWPETGRTHQLRVQTALRGMPILGDTTTARRVRFRWASHCTPEALRAASNPTDPSGADRALARMLG